MCGGREREACPQVRQDDLGKLRTLQVGDGVAAPGWWGQAVRFGGVQFSSNYSLQPGFVTYPLLAIGGLATVPSTTEVLVNDVRLETLTLLDGPQVLSVTSPGPAWKRGENFLTFELGYAEAPKDRIPGAGDSRTLAAAFDWVEIVPVAAPAVPAGG